MGKHFEIEGRPYEDLTGRRFGKLTVIKKAYERVYNGANRTMWFCKCECGKECYMGEIGLLNGTTTDCGCVAKPKAKKQPKILGKRRIRNIWNAMKRRCFDPKSHRAKRYYERGITVCKEWLDFENFLKWSLTHGYADDLTIDRINNDGNYCPENCRWACNDVQQNNRCNNHLITYNGETKTMKDWSRFYGINYKTLMKRINELHWDIDKALNTPTIQNKSSLFRRRATQGGEFGLWDNVSACR